MEYLTQKELARKKQKAEWYQRNKARINAGIKVTKKTEEEVKAHRKLYLKEYGQRPEVKARNNERAQAHRDEDRDEYNAGQRKRYKTQKSIDYRKSYYLKRKAAGYYDN